MNKDYLDILAYGIDLRLINYEERLVLSLASPRPLLWLKWENQPDVFAKHCRPK